jgi:hypothetical protein
MVNSPARPFIAEACVACESRTLGRNSAVLMPFVADRIFGWKPFEITADLGLRTLKPGMAYPLCTTLACQDCGLVFLDMRFQDDQLARLYRNYQDDEYASHRALYEPDYLERNARLRAGVSYLDVVEALIAPHVAEGLDKGLRILDWGGSRGENTPFAGRRGLHHIYDISGEPPVAGAETVSLETARRETYDLIVLSNVLEHLPWPMDTLQALVPCMGEATLLYVEIPHEPVMREEADGPGVLERKRHWHEHVNFYSRRALETLLERAGLDILDITTFEVGAEPGSQFNYGAVCRRRGA